MAYNCVRKVVYSWPLIPNRRSEGIVIAVKGYCLSQGSISNLFISFLSQYSSSDLLSSQKLAINTTVGALSCTAQFWYSNKDRFTSAFKNSNAYLSIRKRGQVS
jgi:hypothetical protein